MMKPQKQVSDEDLNRAQECMAAINQVLGQFKCALAPRIVLGPSGVMSAEVVTVPIPDEQRVIVPNMRSEVLKQVAGNLHKGEK